MRREAVSGTVTPIELWLALERLSDEERMELSMALRFAADEMDAGRDASLELAKVMELLRQ